MATNRFTVRQSDNIQELNEQELLLKIMQETFPDDPYYKQGILSPAQLTKPLFNSNATDVQNTRTSRNTLNVVNVVSGSSQLTEYTINKLIPTVDENILDDLLDDEWEYYVIADQLREPTLGGLFIIPKEMQLNPVDFHDAYIQRGPEALNTLLINNNIDTDKIISNIFCVYYVDNDIAYPIPNYKTLEVMLVERGLTYSAIREADSEQLRKFDMTFDGKFEGDQTPSESPDPIEEFNFRKLPDRTLDWNLQVRFDSGYRPKAPFRRDPGDYLKPIGYVGTGVTDTYVLEDANDRYFDLVFQGQTYKEKLREKYEGKMVIAEWPIPYDNNVVLQNVTINTDDLVLGTRLMINGYWKGLAPQDTTRLYETYAQVNGYSLKDFQAGQGRYGVRGYINLLVNQDAITVLHVQEDERPAIAWDDFAHIAEIDQLDILEYLDYIDNHSNNGQPFDISILNPYEPKGSIQYYKQSQIDKLQQQAAEQAAFENIKEQIYEYWPLLATRVEEFRNRINGLPTNAYSSYFNNRLGDNSPCYKVFTSDEPWTYVKKKRNALKIKEQESNLLKLFEKSTRISANFNKDEENNIVNTGKWGVVAVLDKNTMEQADEIINNTVTVLGNAVPLSLIAMLFVIINGYGLAALLALFKDLANEGKYELPRNYDGTRAKLLMRNDTYVKLMIATELEKRISDAGIKDRIAYADTVISDLRTTIDEASSLLLSLDQRLGNATETSELQDIYTSMIEFYAFLNSINSDDLQYCIDTKQVIDNVLKTHINDMYKSIEYLRKKVHDDVGNTGKFGIRWPESAKAIVNAYLPGKTFTNYLPTQED